MAVCADCATQNPEGARFCNGCGRPLPATSGAAERRKVVTVLFTDLVGSTALGERLDPETVRAILARYFELVRAVIEEHGGTVEKFIGDAAMAVFGIPRVREDDALRAASAALELQRRLGLLNAELAPRWGIELTIRTGINSGEVVASEAGDGPTLVTGDTVNTAARLEQGAEPGEILLGDATRRLVGSAGVLEPRPPLAARGKARPVEAYRLVAMAPAGEVIARRLDTPLVGRGAELRRIQAAFERAITHRLAVGLTVMGDAGVGKSRLIHEFVASARSAATIARGRCLPYGLGITWWPIGEIVRAQADIHADDARSTARRKLGRLLRGADEGSLVSARIAGLVGLSDDPVPAAEAPWAIRRLFQHLARERPLVVAIDDVHWAEPALLDALDRVLEQTHDVAMLLLTIARSEIVETQADWWSAREAATVVRLEPLDRGSVAQLLAGLFGSDALEPGVVGRIELVSEGNPLFVEQLAAYLVETAALRRDGDRLVFDRAAAELAVPPTIGALLAARLDRLPGADRRLAGRGSVIGREFDLPGVLELTPAPEGPLVRGALDDLLRREILLRSVASADGEVFRFRHLLLRDAAYAALPKRERAGLHERFADWLERRFGERLAEVAEVVGYHLEQAYRLRVELGERGGDLDALAVRAGRRLSAAGEAAWWRNDAGAVRNLLERATALLPAGRDRAWALLILGRAHHNGTRLELAVGPYAEARAEAEAAGDAGLAARVAIHETGLLMRTDPERWLATGGTELRRLEQVARAHGNDAAVGWALFYLSAYEISLGRLATSVELDRLAMRFARRAGDVYLEGRCLVSVPWTSRDIAEPLSRGLRACARVLRHQRSDRLTRADVLHTMGVLLAMNGEHDRAVAACREAIALVTDLGTPDAGATAQGDLGEVHLWAEDLERAEAAFRSAVATWRTVGDRANLPWGLAMLGRSVALQGRTAEAIALADEIAAVAASEDVDSQAAWRETRALALAHDGDAVTAEALLAEAVDLRGRTDGAITRARTWLDLADVRLARGDRAGAADAASQALSIYEAKESPVGIRWAGDRLRRAEALS